MEFGVWSLEFGLWILDFELGIRDWGVENGTWGGRGVTGNLGVGSFEWGVEWRWE